jgi:hypothetical protein
MLTTLSRIEEEGIRKVNNEGRRQKMKGEKYVKAEEGRCR